VRIRPARVAVVVFDLWFLAVVACAVFAIRDLKYGTQDVQAARAQLTPAALVTGEPAVALRQAEGRFASAHTKLANPALYPLRFFPVAGRQLRSAIALSGSAEVVARAGAKGVEQAASALDRAPSDGPGRIALLTKLQGIVTTASGELRGLDLGPGNALIGPLADRRRLFLQQLTEARTGLTKADAGVAALHDLLEGPRRYLVLAGNNAEMRAGSGAFLSVGVLESSGGSLHLGEFVPAGDLLVPKPGPAMDPDLAARWGWLEPNREWRNLGVSPRFDATGPLAAAMWEARGGAPVDGVLGLDVAAIKAVLGATGPVDVEGRPVDAGSVEPLLMHDQYTEAATLAEHTIRRERMGAIAGTAVNALEQGSFSLVDLGNGLMEAANGRHILAWARDPKVQAGWAAAGTSGEVPADGLLVGLINRGANKLDRFLVVESRMTTAPAKANGDTEVALAFTLDNRTPDGEIPYIAGPVKETGTAAGEYRGILSVTLPAGATAPRLDQEGTGFVVAGTDGSGTVVAVEQRVPKGEKRAITLRFEMPGRTGEFRLLPSARIPPVEWRRGDYAFNDGVGRTLRW
jgi:hypothetical protein